MSFLEIWLTSGGVILASMLILWLLSLYLKDSSIVDIFWGMGFVITFWIVSLLTSLDVTPRLLITGGLVSLWGVRLSAHIFLRNHGKPEDFRYAAWRKEAGAAWWWRSFFKVFLLQGIILWVVATPLIVIIAGKAASPFGLFDLLGIAVWLVGFIFEAGGDWQLAQFKKDPANKGKLLTTGLWSLTRHPNYFGDAAQWWGFYLLTLSSGGWWTVFSPALMTFLLMKVSGVAMLERTMTKSKPGYEEYIARTNAFLPWLPKK